jgi:hypothetical protein
MMTPQLDPKLFLASKPAVGPVSSAVQTGMKSASPLAMPAMSANAAPAMPMPQPKAANPNPLAGAFASFARGFAPQQTAAVDERYKADGMERNKKALAWMQQTAQLPAEQRAAFTLQSAQDIARDTGQSYEAVVASARDPNAFSDQELKGAIAKFSAMAGIAPTVPEPMTAYQAAVLKQQEEETKRPQGVNLGGGAYAEYDPTAPAESRLRMLQSPDAKPADLPEGMWYGQDGKGPPQPIPGYVDMRTRIARGSQSPSASGDTYRPATAQDLQAWGIPDGTAVKINNRTGEPQVISGAKPASEYTPSQQSKFIQQAQTLDAVDGALKAYTDLIDTAGPQLWTTGLDGDNPVAKQLDAARTAILIQAKELFNLGVLNGPDLDIISSAVPDVTGFDSLGKSPASAKAQLGVLSDYIARGRNQIPEELLSRARPNAPQPNATEDDEDNAFLDKLFGNFAQIAEAAAPSAADMGDDDLKAMLGLD